MASLGAVMVAVAICCASALAGTYDVTTCSMSSNGTTNNAWTSSNGRPASYDVTAQCNGTSGSTAPTVATVKGLSVTDLLQSGTNGAGAEAKWTFAAPAGTSISRIRYYRYLGKKDSEDWRPFLRTAEGSVIDTCDFTDPAYYCALGSPSPTGGFKDIAGLNTSRLDFGLTCAVACSNGYSLHGAWASLYGSTVTITDNGNPTVATPSGGVWAASSWVQGSQTVTVGGSDASGIKSIAAIIDGTTVGQITPACDFTRPRPCSDVSGQSLAVDTTKVTDGSHTLHVVVTDAAGNTSEQTKSIMVDNHAPAAPAVTATGSGQNYTVAWAPAAGDQGSQVSGARYQVCPGGTCGAVQSTSASSFPVHIDQGDTQVRVWLVDAMGNEDPTTASTYTLSYEAPQPPQPTPQDLVTQQPASPAPATDNTSGALPTPPGSSPAADGYKPPSAGQHTTTTTGAVPPRATPSAHPVATRKKISLRLTHAQVSSGALVLSGKLSERFDGTVTILVRQRNHRLRTQAAFHSGTFQTTIRLPRALRSGAIIVSVRFAGDNAHLASSRTTNVDS